MIGGDRSPGDSAGPSEPFCTNPPVDHPLPDEGALAI